MWSLSLIAVHLCTQDGGLCVFTDVRDGPRIPIWSQYIQIVAKGRPTVKEVKKRTLCKSTTAISPNMVSTLKHTEYCTITRFIQYTYIDGQSLLMYV